MLVLSRKMNEQIRIDDQITISILSVKGNVVRVGIEAPNHVRIVRAELPPLDKHQVAQDAKKNDATAESAPRDDSAEELGNDTTNRSTEYRRWETNSDPTRPGSLRSRLQRRMLAMACHS